MQLDSTLNRGRCKKLKHTRKPKDPRLNAHVAGISVETRLGSPAGIPLPHSISLAPDGCGNNKDHTMLIHGACHCGAITYEADVAPTVRICHCTDCQKLSGAAFRAVVVAPRDKFALLTGTPNTYVKTAESGNKRVHAFCGRCGSPIYACAVNDPPSYTLRIGLIRERAEFTPIRQIWCQSALPWAMDIDGVPKVAQQ
jgi:hypothetical protein